LVSTCSDFILLPFCFHFSCLATATSAIYILSLHDALPISFAPFLSSASVFLISGVSDSVNVRPSYFLRFCSKSSNSSVWLNSISAGFFVIVFGIISCIFRLPPYVLYNIHVFFINLLLYIRLLSSNYPPHLG